MTFAVVIHGGAGASPDRDYTEQRAHMEQLILEGRDMLRGGRSALDTVTDLVAELEDSGLYVAGKGSAPNVAGQVELDASIMSGPDRQAGAVAAVCNIRNPVRAARRVLDDGTHVMLAADGAREFALTNGIEAIDDPAAYFTEHVKHGSGDTGGHGTVGAVALDGDGALAAATSTGGTFNKMSGRIGDTPLIGAGTWADDLVAVSCTGFGEAFIRAGAAHDVASRMHYGGADVIPACNEVLDCVKTCGGTGGIIAVDKRGRIAMPYNSRGMKRAAVSDTIDPVVRVFEPED